MCKIFIEVSLHTKRTNFYLTKIICYTVYAQYSLELFSFNLYHIIFSSPCLVSGLQPLALTYRSTLPRVWHSHDNSLQNWPKKKLINSQNCGYHMTQATPTLSIDHTHNSPSPLPDPLNWPYAEKMNKTNNF